MKNPHNVSDRIAHFLRNSSGNFGVMMGVLAFPVIGAMALAVDYSNVMRERSMAQASLDAAALATARQYATGSLSGDTQAETEANLTAYAKDFFEANLPDSIGDNDLELAAKISTQVKQDGNGTPYEQKNIDLGATLEYDTFLAKVLGQDRLVADLTAQVASGNMSVEIALVIDNSGSMGSNSRIQTAKTTSKDLVDQLHAASSASSKPDPIKFSLVPFASMVNVGTSNQNAKWMDTRGWAPIHHENLDWRTYVIPPNVKRFRKIDKGTHYLFRERIDNKWSWKTRFDMFDIMGTSWGGCVEARPWPHNTQDTFQRINMSYGKASSGNHGDGLDALFVPNFAPSEPSRKYRDGDGDDQWDEDNYSNNQYLYRWGWDYLGDWRRPDGPTLGTSNNYTNGSPDSSGDFDDIDWIDSEDDFSAFGDEYADGVIDDYQNLRQDWIWRYQAAAYDGEVWIGSNTSYSNSGPNYLCTTEPIKELTTSQSDIKTAIDAMQARGTTNIQEGIAWGWRSLSEGEPFTEGRGYDEIDNRKYIIVLTDGNNFMGDVNNPNESRYSAWGYAKQGRLDEGLDNADRPDLYKNANLNSLEMKMNVHTLQTCENAREAGVTIFTIAFDVSDGSSVKELLAACGGSGTRDGEPLMLGGEFYFDVEGDELADAMDTIASQIAQLRLMR